MFLLYKGRKRIKFDNGLVLSMFNGFGSHTENKFKHSLINRKIILSKYCEIAILKDNKFITPEVLLVTGDVEGFVTKKELKRIIKEIKKYK